MTTLDLIEDQVELVERHQEVWQSDDEVAQATTIDTVVLLRTAVERIDAKLRKSVEDGQLSPDNQIFAAIGDLLRRSQELARAIVQFAGVMERAGKTAPDVGRIRPLADNFGQGLFVQSLLDEVESLESAGERAIPDATLHVMREAGAKYRHVD